jgi:hypothetical protein
MPNSNSKIGGHTLGGKERVTRGHPDRQIPIEIVVIVGSTYNLDNCDRGRPELRHDFSTKTKLVATGQGHSHWNYQLIINVKPYIFERVDDEIRNISDSIYIRHSDLKSKLSLRVPCGLS